MTSAQCRKEFCLLSYHPRCTALHLLSHRARDPTKHSVSEKMPMLTQAMTGSSQKASSPPLSVRDFISEPLAAFTLHSLGATFPARPWQEQLTSLTEALTRRHADLLLLAFTCFPHYPLLFLFPGMHFPFIIRVTPLLM